MFPKDKLEFLGMMIDDNKRLCKILIILWRHLKLYHMDTYSFDILRQLQNDPTTRSSADPTII